MWEHIGPIAAVLALALNLITAAIAALLKVALTNTQLALQKAIGEAKDEIDARVERESRVYGEIASALRQKIQDMELYVRDNFVRKDTFSPLMSKLENDIRGVGDRIEARMIRMEAKIDEAKKE